MARGLFVGIYTKEELLDLLKKHKEFVDEGKSVMSWTESGSGVTKQWSLPVDVVLEECRHALRLLDPETYGRAPGRVSLTRVPARFPL